MDKMLWEILGIFLRDDISRVEKIRSFGEYQQTLYFDDQHVPVSFVHNGRSIVNPYKEETGIYDIENPEDYYGSEKLQWFIQEVYKYMMYEVLSQAEHLIDTAKEKINAERL